MKTTTSLSFLVSIALAVTLGCKPAVKDEPVVSGLRHPDRVYQLADLLTTKASLGGKAFDLWVMDTDSKRQEGMMFLLDSDYTDTQGMVFAFKELQKSDNGRGFWMKNTISPLDIIYFDKNRKLLNVGKGEPHNETSVAPAGDFLYVVELKQGTAAKMGFKPGDEVNFTPMVAGED